MVLLENTSMKSFNGSNKISSEVRRNDKAIREKNSKWTRTKWTHLYTGRGFYKRLSFEAQMYTKSAECTSPDIVDRFLVIIGITNTYFFTPVLGSLHNSF